MQVNLCPTVVWDVSLGVSSCTGCYWVEEHGSRDIHKAMCNTISHCKFEIYPPLLERLPTKIVYYLRGAACCSIVTSDESGCPALYGFQLFDALSGACIPC